jgi:hypothetical protein
VLSLAPAVEVAFWSLVLGVVEAAVFWSAVVLVAAVWLDALLLGAAAAVAPVPEVEVAVWSAVVAGGVEAALDDAGAEEALDEVEEAVESRELLEVALDGVAGAALVDDGVEEAEELWAADWSAVLVPLTGAEPGFVGPVEGVELAVPVVGALPVVVLLAVLSLLGVVALVLLVLLAVDPCETVEFEAVALDWEASLDGEALLVAGVALALDAGCWAEALFALEDGWAALLALVSLDELIEEPEEAVEGWLVEALEFEAALLLQLSEIIFTESTFSVLMSVVSGEPFTCSVCPTCALRSWVFPASFQFLPELSTNV